MTDTSKIQFDQWHKRETQAFIAAGEVEAARVMEGFKESMWSVWQASREAVELPQPFAVIGDYAACGGGKVVMTSELAEKITDQMCEKTPVYDLASLVAAGLLRGVALEVKGPEAPLRRHGFHDLPLCVKTLVQERDRLKAENESLKGSCKAMGKDMAKVTRERNSARSKAEKLKAENEALRKSLIEASEEIAAWGAYASEYFQQKHDLAGCVEKFHVAAMAKEQSHD